MKWIDVMNHPNYMISENGTLKNKKGKIIKSHSDKDGYLQCNISTKGIVKKIKLHRVVGEHFIPNPMGLETINHDDFDKTNNKYTNLSWMSRKDNIEHYYKKNSKISQSKHPHLYHP